MGIRKVGASRPDTAHAVHRSHDVSTTQGKFSSPKALSLLSLTFDNAGRISTQTGIDTIFSSGSTDSDVPLPAWVPLLLGAGLLAASLFTLAIPHPAQAADLSLQYDPNGNVSSKATPSGTSTYTYDALDRINTESGPTGSHTHSFDGNDNRTSDGTTSTSFTANSDRLATINGVAVTLDAAGHMTNDGTYQYVWDDWGDLKEVHLANGTLLATYYYDYRHLRTRKVTTSAAPQGVATVYYFYGLQDHLIAEMASSNTPLMTYIWNDDRLTGVIVHQPQRTVYTVQTDQLGSPFQVRTLQGKVVWRWEPDAFGKTLPNEDADGDGVKLTLNLRFPGQYYDRESGLHYNWHRYYSPKLARYLSPDPIGIQGGANEYAYVAGNPISYTDPLGLWVYGTYDRSTGMLTLHDQEKGTTISGPFESGGKPFGDPIPNGVYDILARAGRDGFYRLEPVDSTYGDDTEDNTGRTHFRLHHPGRTLGCVAAKDDKNWIAVENFINSTQSDNVKVPSMSRSPWAPPTETLPRYGRIEVIH